MPDVWRIVTTRRVRGAFDGEGARLYGGRWNSPGTRMVYTAEHASLAVLELLVHLHDVRQVARYSLLRARVPDRWVEVLDPARLPAGWRAHPAPAALQEIGDEWAASRRSLALRVPSAVVPDEGNYLLNPAHREFRRVAIGPPQAFALDPRLR